MNGIQSAQSNAAGIQPLQDAAGGLLGPELAALSTLKLLPNPSPAFPGTLASQISRHISQPLADRKSLSIGPFLANALGCRWKVYRARIGSCRDDFSEQKVHKFRVATRRLIAQLLIVGCVTPGRTPEKARRVLKRQLKVLGELRDTHVQRLFIQCRMARFPELILVEDVLRRREHQLEKAAAGKVIGFKARKLEKWILALQLRLAMTPTADGCSDELLKAATRATTRAFAKLVSRRKAIDPANPDSIHRTRIAFKKFRYMVESLSPNFTGLDKRQLRELAHYQERMGILQDLEIIERCIIGYVRQEKEIGTLLTPFSRYLQATRTRALRSFLKSADDLFEFWPPTRVGPMLTPGRGRNQSTIPGAPQGQGGAPDNPQDRGV
jgi:CHAD domain-containing protein